MTTHKVTRLGDIITMDEAEWVFLGLDGARSVLLQRVGTNTQDLSGRRVIALPALYDLVGPSKVDRLLRPAKDTHPDDVIELASHIDEVASGRPMGGGEPRTEYDPTTTTQEGRLRRKLEELAGTRLAMSRAKFFRLLKTYRDGGHAALDAALHPQRAAALATAGADPALIATIDQVVAETTESATPNLKQLIGKVRRRHAEAYPDVAINVGDKQLGRYVTERSAGRYTLGAATTRRTAANSPNRAYVAATPGRPGAIVEIDSTPFDILLTRDEDGMPYRPTLTLMWDVATAIPLAWAITPGPAKGFDNAALLARAIVPRKAVPGQDATRLQASATLPAEAMQAVNSWLGDDSLALPYIFPEEITLDGGKDFRSTVFTDACLRYGISLNLAAPYTPTQKPHVERAFNTIREGFVRYLAGYTGPGVSHRGKRDDPVWSLAALDMLFEMWVSTVYLNTPTEALRDPLHPDLKWTPNQKYAASFSVAAGLPIPFGTDDYVALLPWVERKIDIEGVRLHNRIYAAPALASFRRRSSTLPSGKWRVHYNPYSTASVWMRNPETDQWIELIDRSLVWADVPFAAEFSTALASGDHPVGLPGEDAWQQLVDEIAGQESAARRQTARSHRRSNVPQPPIPVPLKPQAIEPDTDAPGPRRRLGLDDPKEAL